MKDYLDPIFSAATTDQVCVALQSALDSLRGKNYLAKLPDYYEEIAARNPTEIQDWFDEMKDDDQAKEEGNLKEVFGLFDAALQQLRKLGFHRA
jgi:hypothetical protein